MKRKGYFIAIVRYQDDKGLLFRAVIMYDDGISIDVVGNEERVHFFRNETTAVEHGDSLLEEFE